MNIEPSNKLKDLPPYAFAEIDKKVSELKEAFGRGEASAPIDFGVGDPSEPTPDFVIEGLCDAGKKHASSGYPSYVGSGEFRKVCAEYMERRFGIELDPEREICSSIGSKEAVFNFPQGFINRGNIVICPSPGYPPYKTGTAFADGEPYFTPLLEENNFLVDFDSIPEEICERAKILWINYPNSPTGAVADRAYYEKLIEWAHKWEIIIAADEGCYIDIYFEEKPLSILEVSREGIVVFYSTSKRNNMTGYRAGFVCGDERVIEIYKKLKTNIDSGVPSIVQEAAMIALKDDDHAQHMRELYSEKRDILARGLKNIGLEVRVPEATFYVWLRVPDGMSDVEFAEKLLSPEIAIVVTPGSAISDECEGGVNPGAGYVRFALMPTLEEMHEAVERLKKFSA